MEMRVPNKAITSNNETSAAKSVIGNGYKNTEPLLESRPSESKFKEVLKATGRGMLFGTGVTVALVGIGCIEGWIPHSNRILAQFATLNLAIYGGMNAMRYAFIGSQQSAKDNSAFMKWGVPAGIFSFGLSGKSGEFVIASLAAGMASVVYHRIKSRKEQKQTN